MRRIQTAFTGGELSPRLHGRVDLKQYSTAVKTMESAYPLSHGGARKRPGTTFVGAIASSNEKAKLIPFVYSRKRSYVLVLNDQKIEFIHNGHYIPATNVVVNGTFDTNLSSWTDKSTGTGTSAWVAGAAQLDSDGTSNVGAFEQTLTTVAATTYTVSFDVGPGSGSSGTITVGTSTGAQDLLFAQEFDQDSAPTFSFTATSVTSFLRIKCNGDTVPTRITVDNVRCGTGRHSIATPYEATDLSAVRYTQKGNKMIFVHPNHAPTILDRGATDVAWAFSPIDFTYQALNDQWFVSDFLTFKLFTPQDGTTAFAVGDTYQITTSGSGVISSQGWTSGPVANTDITGIEFNATTDPAGGTTWVISCNFATSQRQEFNVYGAAKVTTVADVAGSLNNTYFYVSSVLVDYYVWYNVNSGGSDPAIANKVGIEVDVATGATDTDVATATQLAVDAIDDLQAVVDTNKVSIGTSQSGYQNAPASAQTSGFTVAGTIFTPTAEWSANNYPNAVAFHEQRLMFGGSPSYPQSIWGSQVGDYTTMTVGPLDADAVNFIFDTNTFDEIYHLASARALLVFTFGGESTVQGSVLTGTITPSAVLRPQTGYGVKNAVAPIRIGEEVLMIDRTGKRCRSIIYDVSVDANTAEDLTILSEHITGTLDGVEDMSHQSDPDSIIWLPRDDGVLLSLAHKRENGVTAWSRNITQTSAGQSVVENVTTIPEGTRDITYLIIRRVVNGVTYRYLEFFNYDIHTDSSITYVGTATITITGLNHLEGESVRILADGKVHPAKTVSSGSVTLDYTAEEVKVGLGYAVTLDLLHPEVQSNSGTSQGAHLSINKIVVKMQETIGLTLHVKDQAGNILKTVEVPVLQTNSPMDTAPVPFSGDKEINLKGGYNPPFILSLTNDLPTPWTILSVVEFIDVEE